MALPMSDLLAQHLRRVLSGDAYHSAVQGGGAQSLEEMVAAIESTVDLNHCDRRADEPDHFYPTTTSLFRLGGLSYSVNLLRRIIIARLQLLCVSAELENDIEYAFSEFRSVCIGVEAFNGHLIPKMKCTSNVCGDCEVRTLQFEDIAEVVVSTHSRRIASRLLRITTAVTAIQEAKFEAAFLRALVGMVATYTSLLNGCCLKATIVYVSESMFSLSRRSPISWLDCLIPGAQSEDHRLTVQLLLADVWRAVSTSLVASNQPLLTWEGLTSQLHHIAKQEGLQYHPAATKCLWYAASLLDQQQALSRWDSGFDLMLVSSSPSRHRGYKPSPGKHTTHATWLLQSQVLPPIRNSLTDAVVPLHTFDSAAVARHIDILRLSQPLCGVLSASTRQAAVFLVQGLTATLASGNLRVAAQLLCVDGPEICRALAGTTTQAARVSSPGLIFPMCSHLHAIEHQSRGGYSVAHSLSWEIKDLLVDLSIVFHDSWRQRCAEVLKATFPSRKTWNSINKKTAGATVDQLTPSGYCDDVIQQLLLPVVEAATHLPEDPQSIFVGLSVCIFVNEFRKAVTTEKKTYRTTAGHQLLTDFRHVLQWLTSEEVGLGAGTSQMLATLPALAEVERGLSLVCGTTDTTELPSETMGCLYTCPTFSHLPVFSEQAWNSTQDWLNCVA